MPRKLRIHRGFGTSAIFGIALISVAVFMIIPAGVNFPESWAGAVVALSVATVGVALVLAEVRRSKVEKPGSATKGDSNAF